MSRTKTVLAVTASCMMLLSCTFVDSARGDFVRIRNWHIGTNVDLATRPPPSSVVKLSDDETEYHYHFINAHFHNETCVWVYVVDTVTRRIKSWRFISPPDACYESFQWGQPW